MTKAERMERDHRAMEKLRADNTEGSCPALVNDDAGHWQLSYAGHAPIPPNPETVTVFCDEDEWHDDPADAILATEGGEHHDE